MTIAQLKSKLLYYLHKADADIDTDFMAGENDMLLDALNSARQAAEILYAFELNRVTVPISVDAVAGGNWFEVVVGTEEDAVTYNMNSLKRAWKVLDDGSLKDVDFVLKSTLPTIPDSSTRELLYIEGTQIFQYPSNVSTVYQVEGYKWMADYSADEDEDWMCKFGNDLLFWGALNDLNYRFKEFVPRQEGNLSLSQQRVDQEMQKLIVWDNRIRNSTVNLLN